MRTLEELMGRVSGLEAALAAIELSATRLRFCMQRLPADGGPAYASLIETLQDYEQSLATLHKLHQDALWDLEAMRKRNNSARRD